MTDQVTQATLEERVKWLEEENRELHTVIEIILKTIAASAQKIDDISVILSFSGILSQGKTRVDPGVPPSKGR